MSAQYDTTDQQARYQQGPEQKGGGPSWFRICVVVVGTAVAVALVALAVAVSHSHSSQAPAANGTPTSTSAPAQPTTQPTTPAQPTTPVSPAHPVQPSDAVVRPGPCFPAFGRFHTHPRQHRCRISGGPGAGSLG